MRWRTSVGDRHKPTVLLNPPADAKVSCAEIWPRCLCLRDGLDAGIDVANSLPFSFQAAVFTESIETAMRASICPTPRPHGNDHTASASTGCRLRA